MQKSQPCMADIPPGQINTCSQVCDFVAQQLLPKKNAYHSAFSVAHGEISAEHVEHPSEWDTAPCTCSTYSHCTSNSPAQCCKYIFPHHLSCEMQYLCEGLYYGYPGAFH